MKPSGYIDVDSPACESAGLCDECRRRSAWRGVMVAVALALIAAIAWSVAT